MSDPIIVPLRKNTNNPIVVGIQHNEVMNAYEVVLTVGNFKDRYKAETAARHIIRLVEDELGSRAVNQILGN